MNDTRKLIDRQVRRVHRRLFLRTLLQSWLFATAGALAVSAMAFLARPFLFAAAPAWLNWSLPSSLIVLGALIAIVWSWKTSPSRVASALALDQAFALKERVTTFCTLTPEAAASAAGQLLVEDVRQRVGKLDVPGHFPVSLRWQTVLWPLGAGALAVAASFFDPTWLGATVRPDQPKKPVVDAREIQQQLDNLRKVKTDPDKDALKSEKLKELEDAWNKLLDKPFDPNDREKVRERANEMRSLEEKIKDRIRDLKGQAEKNHEIKKQLDQLAKDLDAKGLEKGPMKDLHDALAKADLDKARQILDQLAKEMDKLGKDDQKNLANQMKNLQEKLGKLANQKEQKEKLQRDRKDAQQKLKELQDKLNKLTDKDMKDKLQRLLDEKQRELDQMENELENLDQQEQDLQDLQDLADALDECQKCLNKGDGKQAGEKLKTAMEKLKIMELTEEELKMLQEQQEALEEARLAMLQACQEGH